LLKNAEIPASSFDMLMRWSDFNGLDLMVSLSNHGLHRFSAACQKVPFPLVIPETKPSKL
jgi:hypothetical protein